MSARLSILDLPLSFTLTPMSYSVDIPKTGSTTTAGATLRKILLSVSFRVGDILGVWRISQENFHERLRSSIDGRG
jgi:hypothetical protein